MPEDVETGGIDAVCPDCAQKYALGEPLAKMDSVNLVELPLNARMEDVLGGADERAAVQDRFRIRRGLLAQADRNLLYIDEVNLLEDEITDAILDAAAQGRYSVRRGPVSATYRSRFTLIGSMNPEEGRLRPQIMDRFGYGWWCVGWRRRMKGWRLIAGCRLTRPTRVRRWPSIGPETSVLRDEIQGARDALAQVELPEEVARLGLAIVRHLQIDSLRAEITLFEAARAYAAADSRLEVQPEDLYEVAPLALRARRSTFMVEFFSSQQVEEGEIKNALDQILKGYNPKHDLA